MNSTLEIEIHKKSMSTATKSQTENLTVTKVDNLPEKKIWTDAEFMVLSKDEHRYEIVNGELIDMGNSGAKHGYICSILMIILGGYIYNHKLGAIFDSSTAFAMKSGNKRSPDFSFVSKERLQGLEELPDGFLPEAPDLAVEILSPNNTVEEIHNKIVEYFENSARLVWVIHPHEQYVLVYHSPRPDILLKLNDLLDGEEVIPGFSFPVSHLFQKLSFE